MQKGMKFNRIWLGTPIDPWCLIEFSNNPHWSIRELKPKHEWDKADNEGSEVNARAFFSIFNRVCLEEFHKIENYKRAKKVWDILQVTHEGVSTIKISKL